LPLRRDAPLDTDQGWLPSALLLSLGVGAGGWWVWQQRRGKRSGMTGTVGRERGGVVRLASQALTAQASVHAVQWNGEEYLLACTAQQVTLLGKTTSVQEGGPREQQAA
jgi:flagellar biogenesis protein FliO